jgi:hypothetical protein
VDSLHGRPLERRHAQELTGCLIPAIVIAIGPSDAVISDARDHLIFDQ